MRAVSAAKYGRDSPITAPDSERDHIQVFLRVRPLTTSEPQKPALGVIESANSVRIESNSKRGISLDFAYDGVFSPNCSQAQVNKLVGVSCVKNLLQGYNATIFAYGQTGSGKTYTMYGLDEDARQWGKAMNSTVVGSGKLRKTAGLVPRITAALFQAIEGETVEDTTSTNKLVEKSSNYLMENAEIVIKCTFLEIYNENVRDLLYVGSDSANRKLRIRETSRQGVWVEGVTEEFVTCEQDVADLVRMGFRLRSVGTTKLNERSSRSHCVFTLVLQQTLPNGQVKSSRLNLVDLAGSERIGRSGVEGLALREAQNINTSLSSLGNCISALLEKGQGRRSHIPYRDSKLTHLLKESLGGNARTHIVLTVSPARPDVDETLGVLRFGARASSVTTHAIVNVQKSVEELTLELKTLKALVVVLEAENNKLKKSISQGKTKNSRIENKEITIKPIQTIVKAVNEVNEVECCISEESAATNINIQSLSKVQPPAAPIDEYQRELSSTPPVSPRREIFVLEQKVKELNSYIIEIEEARQREANEIRSKLITVKDERTSLEAEVERLKMTLRLSEAVDDSSDDIEQEVSVTAGSNEEHESSSKDEATPNVRRKSVTLQQRKQRNESRAAAMRELSVAWAAVHKQREAVRKGRSELEHEQCALAQTLSLRLAEERALRRRQEQTERVEANVKAALLEKQKMLDKREKELDERERRVAEGLDNAEQTLLDFAEQKTHHEKERLKWKATLAQKDAAHAETVIKAVAAAAAELEQHQKISSQQELQHQREKLLVRQQKQEASVVSKAEKQIRLIGHSDLSDNFSRLWEEAAAKVASQTVTRNRVLKLTGSGMNKDNTTAKGGAVVHETKLLSAALRLRREQLIKNMNSPIRVTRRHVSNIGEGDNSAPRPISAGSGANAALSINNGDYDLKLDDTQVKAKPVGRNRIVKPIKRQMKFRKI